jgi:hypothetical protein
MENYLLKRMLKEFKQQFEVIIYLKSKVAKTCAKVVLFNQGGDKPDFQPGINSLSFFRTVSSKPDYKYYS